MIFAAGLGTRLYPLTADKPKALVEFQGKTLLEHAITKVMESGIQHIVVNIHHFGEQIIEFVNQHHFNVKIDISDEREKLLDTAGGLKHAEHFFKNCNQILLSNVDVISSIDLKRFVVCGLWYEVNDAIVSPSNFEEASEGRGSLYTHLATLAVRHRQTERYFLFEEPELRLCGWENTKTNEKKICYEVEKTIPLAFSGIHLVNKKTLDFIPKNEKKSFTPLYLELAKNHVINGYLHDEDTWKDLGKIDEYELF
jgi:NDP-sugar pyrophosphorylase family protein